MPTSASPRSAGVRSSLETSSSGRAGAGGAARKSGRAQARAGRRPPPRRPPVAGRASEPHPCAAARPGLGLAGRGDVAEPQESPPAGTQLAAPAARGPESSPPVDAARPRSDPLTRHVMRASRARAGRGRRGLTVAMAGAELEPCQREKGCLGEACWACNVHFNLYLLLTEGNLRRYKHGYVQIRPGFSYCPLKPSRLHPSFCFSDYFHQRQYSYIKLYKRVSHGQFYFSHRRLENCIKDEISVSSLSKLMSECEANPCKYSRFCFVV